MPHNDETFRALREALSVSPDNIALRRHLAELLVSAGKLNEAVTEYRQALGISPRDDSLRLPLAKLYMDLGNDSAASVIVEEILKLRSPPPAAYLVYAQVLLNTNQPDRAAHAYRQAVADDPSLADADLARNFGIHPKTGRSPESDEFDDDDRRIRLPASEAGEVDFDTRVGTAEDLFRRCRRHGVAERRNPPQNTSSARQSRSLQDVRQIGRRRNSDVRPARLRQDLSRSRDRGRGQGRISCRGNRRRAGHVAGQQRAPVAQAFRDRQAEHALHVVLR